MNTAAPIEQVEITPFQSLTRMREAHTELIRNHRESGSSAKLIEAAIEFVRRARATGTIIDQDADRCTAQGLLDYWLTIIYRSGREFPDSESTLQDFDISRQPELKSSDCPYVGLETFSEAKAEFFFGRQKLVKQWISKLAKHRLIAVIGPSGSGKASLISAGVVPALRSGAVPGSEHWRYFPMIAPGANPLRNVIDAVGGDAAGSLDEMAAAMRKSPMVLLGLVERDSTQPALLVFPRFEEVFTLAREEDRKALAENLIEVVEAPRGHRVLVAIRNEFVAHLVQLGPLQAQLQKGEVFVPPFDASELREVVEQPAARVGLKFDDGLVDALIYDVLGDPATLPLLQFMLLKLWDRRERNRITWKVYREIGGCRVAFERMAEEMFSKLNSPEREILKAILLRIVRPGAAREIVCSTVRRASLYDGAHSRAQVDRGINALLYARLVRISGDEAVNQRIGIIDEALVTKWPRFIEWLDDERTKMRQRQRLTIVAAQWKEKHEDPGALWGGLLLEEVRRYDDLNDLEQEFIDASVRASRRRKRLRRCLVFAGVMALAVILTLVWVNLWQRYKLQNEKLRMAYVERGMRLLDAGDPSGGDVWFAQLFKFEPPEPIRTDVYRRRLEIGLRQLPRLLQVLPHDREAPYAEMSGDGRHIVTVTTRGVQSAKPSDAKWAIGAETAWLWTIKDHQPAQPIRLQSELPANGIRISPDGKLVATVHGARGKGSGEVRIWDITGDEPNCIHQLACQGAVTIAAWSPDSTRLAFAQEIGTTSHGQAMVWDWRNETEPGKSLPSKCKISRITWSPRGDRIATASGDQQNGEVKLWNLTSDKNAAQGDQFCSLRPDTAINDVVFSSDGELLLTCAGTPGGESGTAQIWKTTTGERAGLPLPHKGAVLTARFSPDDKLVVTASTDGTARVWSAASGREMLSLPHNAWVYCATFSPDGRYIATGSRDRMARVWDLLSGQLAIPPMNHGGTVNSIAFSSDGRRLITTCKETPRVWALATGITPAPAFNTDGPVLQAAFSRDGKRIVTITEVDSGKSWKVHVWDAATGNPLSAYEHNVPITRAVLSDDGSRVALIASDVEHRLYQALVIDARSGKALYEPIQLDGDGTFIAFGHAGARHFITLTRDDKGEAKVARVWNSETGEPLTDPLSHEVPLCFATLSREDALLLTTGGERSLPKEGKAFIWSVRPGEQKPIILTHDEFITHAEFSADGQHVVTASEDNYARVWRTADGHPLSGLLKNLHTADLSDVSFSPDGNWILTASYDQTAVVCDWRSEKIVSVFRHAGMVNGARFSPDGRRVITASSDRTARLWDIQSNELIAILNHSGPVQEASFSGDGNTIFALSYNVAAGPTGSFQQGVPVASLPDEAFEPPRRTIQAQTWNIAVDRKHSDAELQDIAELLAAQSYGQNERLDMLPTDQLVNNWRRLTASYLSDFNEEPTPDFYARSAAASEADKQWFAATWHLSRLLEKNDADSTLRQRRAMAYSQLRKWDEAIADYNIALNSRKDDDVLLSRRAQAFTEAQKWDEAASDCEAVIAHSPKAALARLTLALVRCQQGRADDAAEQLRKILELDPDHSAAWQRRALVELKRGDLDGYRAACAAMLQRFKDKPKLGSIVGWPCILAPQSVEDISLVVELARKAVESSPANYYRMNTLGAALYRAGKYPEAIEALDRSRTLYASSVATRIAELRDDSFQPLSKLNQGRAVDWVFLAMAHFQQGNKGGAEYWLKKLKETVEFKGAAGTEIASERRLWSKMELEILYTEAKTLITPSGTVP